MELGRILMTPTKSDIRQGAPQLLRGRRVQPLLARDNLLLGRLRSYRKSRIPGQQCRSEKIVGRFCSIFGPMTSAECVEVCDFQSPARVLLKFHLHTASLVIYYFPINPGGGLNMRVSRSKAVTAVVAIISGLASRLH